MKVSVPKSAPIRVPKLDRVIKTTRGGELLVPKKPPTPETEQCTPPTKDHQAKEKESFLCTRSSEETET